MSGEPKTHTLEKRRESAAATILRHLQAGPATVVELMDRIHADTTRPEVGTPGWRIVTTHLVADTLSAVEALGDLLGQKFLSRDERGAIALTLPLGVPVVARDEAALTYRGQPISVAAAQAILDVFPRVVDNTREIEAQILELRNGLRRLAGGENEK